MMGTRSNTIVMLTCAMLALLFYAPDVFAFADDITIGGFTCYGGLPNGQLIVSSGTCPTTLSMDHLFSFLICNFEQLSSNLMGYMFCGMISNLAPTVWKAATLAIAIYGVSFTIGLIPATGRDAMLFLLKITFITAFATQSDLLIGYGYKLLLSGMSDGANIALTVISKDSGISTAAGVYAEIDKLLSNLFHFAIDKEGQTDPAALCKNAVFALLALMMVILPVMAYVAIMLVGRLLMTFFRAVFAYIYAIVGITFLLTLAPFFLSFYLFKQTSNLFDRWLGYLVSFALQVVLLFGFLAFVILIEQAVMKNNVLQNLTNIIMYHQEAPEATAIRLNLTYCTLCDFKVVDGPLCTSTDSSTCPEILPNYTRNIPATGNTPAHTATYIELGKMVCKANPPEPVKPTFATSPDGKNQIKSLLTLLGEGLIPLVVLAMLVENLLKLIPSLAQKLASNLGATYAAQLGGGWQAGGAPVTAMPGEYLVQDFSAGFETGFNDAANPDGLKKTAQGLKDGMAGMLTGRRANGSTIFNEAGAPVQDGGAQNSFARWFANPNRFGF